MVGTIVAIFAGLVLLSGALRSVPSIGPGLEKFARWLSAFDIVIGVIAIVAGILSPFGLEGIMLILAGLVLAASALASIPSIGRPLADLGNSLGRFRLIIGLIVLLMGLWSLISSFMGALGHA